MKINAVIALAVTTLVLISGCATKIDQLPTEGGAITFGQYATTDPRWEPFRVGTILLFQANSSIPTVIDSGKEWLTAAGVKETADMAAMIAQACDPITKKCTWVTVDNSNRGFEASFNAKLGSFEASGKGIRAVSSKSSFTDKLILRTSNQTDGIVEWNRFRTASASAEFSKKVLASKGTLPGILALVSRIDIAQGSLEYTLNATLDVKAQALLLQRLNLAGSELKVTFNNDKLTIESTPRNPFILGWTLHKIDIQ